MRSQHIYHIHYPVLSEQVHILAKARLFDLRESSCRISILSWDSKNKHTIMFIQKGYIHILRSDKISFYLLVKQRLWIARVTVWFWRLCVSNEINERIVCEIISIRFQFNETSQAEFGQCMSCAKVSVWAFSPELKREKISIFSSSIQWIGIMNGLKCFHWVFRGAVFGLLLK